MKYFSLFLFILMMQTTAAFALEVTGRAVIVDGDTIYINQTKIRLLGIDAPEAGQKCKKPNGGSWPCGNEATKAISKLAAGNEVTCKGDEWDQFGRLIAVCSADDFEINAELVRKGLAWNYDEFSAQYKQLELEARKKHFGIFQAPTITAWDFRAKRWKVEIQISPEGCPIKGNISKNGKIYHTPWSPAYNRTRVSPEKGERWFCDENEAIKAGWRAPKWK